MMRDNGFLITPRTTRRTTDTSAISNSLVLTDTCSASLNLSLFSIIIIGYIFLLEIKATDTSAWHLLGDDPESNSLPEAVIVSSLRLLLQI